MPRYSVGIYEKQVEDIIRNTTGKSSTDGTDDTNDSKIKMWGIGFLALLLLGVLGYIIYKLIKKPNQENYEYLHHILAKNCNLTLPDYIKILNETSNTQSISLQELCQNWVCNVEQVDKEKVLKMIATVAKPAIVKCLNKQDWLRLALINLKIYNIINLFDKSFVAERALTNGVYGVEYINIPKQDLIEIIKYIPTNVNEKTEKEFAKKNGFSRLDEESLLEYTNFLNKFLKEGVSILTDVMNCKQINPFIFALVTTVNIGNIVFKVKSEC